MLTLFALFANMLPINEDCLVRKERASCSLHKILWRQTRTTPLREQNTDTDRETIEIVIDPEP